MDRVYNLVERPLQTIRASLKPYYHKRRRVWYSRGSVPIRREDGTLEYKRGYLGGRFSTQAACRAECDRLNSKYEADAKRNDQRDRINFNDAAHQYLLNGGDPAYITTRLIDRIGKVDCRDITNAHMTALVAEFWPNGSKPSTQNRNLYTPVISVLKYAKKGRSWALPEIERPKGYSKLPAIKPPKDDWYGLVLPHCRPQLRALLLLLRIHGRRRKDAVTRLPEHFDPDARTIDIEATKNGNALRLQLAKPVIDAIQAYDWRAGPGLFGSYTQTNKRNVNRDLANPRVAPHTAGRHAFATDLMRKGMNLRELQVAGDWKSISMAARYAHLEQSEISDRVKEIGDKFGEGEERVVPIRPAVVTTRLR